MPKASFNEGFICATLLAVTMFIIFAMISIIAYPDDFDNALNERLAEISFCDNRSMTHDSSSTIDDTEIRCVDSRQEIHWYHIEVNE